MTVNLRAKARLLMRGIRYGALEPLLHPGLAVEEAVRLFDEVAALEGRGRSVACIGCQRPELPLVLVQGIAAGAGACVELAVAGPIPSIADPSGTVTLLGADAPRCGQDYTRSIDLIVFDGGHEYGEARAQFEAWIPHLKESGVVAVLGLDAAHGGPRRLVSECLGDPSRWCEGELVDNTYLARGRSQAQPAWV